MERQPVLLLESYGLVHTAFNRMEDVQVIAGGSVGRNFCPFFSGSSELLEYGAGLGYRWVSDDLSQGFDLIVYHYERNLAEESELDGTFYGGDLDLIDGVGPHSIPTRGNDKEEAGARLFGEWNGGTVVIQYVSQDVAGLGRDGFDVEAGWLFPVYLGPVAEGGTPMITSVQPAIQPARHRLQGCGDLSCTERLVGLGEDRFWRGR